MDFLKAIREDEDIQELKKCISESGGFVPGFGFWDGETIEEYRERLREIAKELKENRQ